MSKRFPGRRLSWVRLTVLALVVGGLGYAGYSSVRALQDDWVAEESTPWFSAYVDATATPSYEFEVQTGDDQKTVTLSFIVAASPTTCEPTWGTHYTLDEAAADLDLDRRIARHVRGGGEAIVSFGGLFNAELALACDSVDELADQYRAIIDRYDLTTIDLDIEGDALADTVSRERRADAIAQLQDEQRDAGRQPVAVWLTLPVAHDGLTGDGVSLVQEMLDAGVALAGVNVMTMNFTGDDAAADPAAVAITALEGTHRQLRAIYADRDQPMGAATAWRMVGATPMIGQNDVRAEVFGLDDAAALNAFAVEKGLGRMSMWSANRDQTCAEAYPDWQIVSDACSGIQQDGQRFGQVLAAGFEGSPSAAADAPSPTPNATSIDDLVDDPETSPYPVWDENASYPAETRVVWRRSVYVAKWWSSGDQPDNPALSTAENPWRLIGPVLDGETPIPEPQLPDGFYPTWEGETTYSKNDRVMLDGVAYEARWWTQAENPAAGQQDPGNSPWRRLTTEEVEKLLEGEE